MADGGWIKLHRKITKSVVWSDPQRLKLWILILTKARHTDGVVPFNGREQRLNIGQCITGRVALRDEMNLGVRPALKVNSSFIYRALKDFESLGMLNIESNSQYSVITVLNWDEYQQSEQVTNSYRTANEQLTNTNKNVKNEQEVKPSSHKSTKRTYDEQSKELRAATKLWELIQRNNPKAKQQDLQKWADVFRLMHERDNRSWKDIGTLIQWSQNDGFWSANILSANKLRKQFDQLTAKMNQEGGGFVPEQPPLETPHTFSAAEYAVSAYQTGSSIDEIIEMAKDEGAPATPDEIRAAIDAYNKQREEDD
jgi:hypothetical protein